MTLSIAYIIPTRDRPGELALTLATLARLDHPDSASAEVIVIDNASRHPPTPPRRLTNGLTVRLLLRPTNEAAASRNHAANATNAQWLIMLDDDSAPLDMGFLAALRDAPAVVAAVGAKITLPSGRHESGGLPEVPIGCGVALRRELFLAVGGYDPAFHFYAEEYDLAARLLLAGHRVIHDPRFRVLHRKVAQGRDMDTILHHLVRNNAWVEQRYAPEPLRRRAVAHIIERYAVIADKENARTGYERGLAELRDSLSHQPRREMPPDLYDLFTGLAHARGHLGAAVDHLGIRNAALVHPGKHAALVEQTLRELSVSIVAEPSAADARVIATLSPGPMLDALEDLTSPRARTGHCDTEPISHCDASGKPVLTPWRLGAPAPSLFPPLRQPAAR